MTVSVCQSIPFKAVSAIENAATGALALSYLATILLFAFGAPAFAAESKTRAGAPESIVGIVERHTVTLKLRDGTTRTFAVMGDLNLGYADDGDEVRVTIEKNKITSITLANPAKDRK